MTLGFDDVTLTSTGTATAETQLNDGASLTSPDAARLLLEVIPYQMELGAFTADESLFTAFRLGSDDVIYYQKDLFCQISTQETQLSQVYKFRL